MQDQILNIQRLIKEHNQLREQGLNEIKINELEVINDLRFLRDSLLGRNDKELESKLNDWSQAIEKIRNSLEKHFKDEEQILPSVLNESLTNAIIQEHKKIKEELNSICKVSSRKELGEIKDEGTLAITMYISQKVHSLLDMVKEHSMKEDVIFKMLLSGLPEKQV